MGCITIRYQQLVDMRDEQELMTYLKEKGMPTKGTIKLDLCEGYIYTEAYEPITQSVIYCWEKEEKGDD